MMNNDQLNKVKMKLCKSRIFFLYLETKLKKGLLTNIF